MKHHSLIAALLLTLASAALHAASLPPSPLTWSDLFGNTPASRIPGSPANLATEAAMDRLFAESGMAHGQMTFTAPCFKPGKTSFTAEGKTYEIRPMHPTLFRPGNFLEKQFQSKLVYGGRGRDEDLAAMEGQPLDGSLVLLDFNCGIDWQRFLRFGVKGFVFIDDGTATTYEAQAKLVSTEIRLPRFQIHAKEGEALKALIQNKGALDIQVQAQPSIWVNQELRNLWAIVPGTTMPQEAIILYAPMDANCIVPELAQGAQGGANLLLLAELFRQYAANPPARTIVFFAVNAHTQNLLGERVMAWATIQNRSFTEKALDQINANLRVDNMYLGHYSKLNLNPPTPEDNQFFIDIRDMMDFSTGKNIIIKEPLLDLARGEVNKVKGELLKLARMKLPKEEEQARRQELNDLKRHYVNVLTLFNKAGIKTTVNELDHVPCTDGSDKSCTHPKDFELQILRGYVDKLVRGKQEWSRLNQHEIDSITANNKIREQLNFTTVKTAIALELDWSSDLLAFSSGDLAGNRKWMAKFGQRTMALDAALERKPAYGQLRLEDTMTKKGGKAEPYFFPNPTPTTYPLMASGNLPAFVLRNPYSAYLKKFSTADKPEALDPQRLSAVLNYVPQLFRAIADETTITLPSELPKAYPFSQEWQNSWFTQIRAFKFDDFSASVLPQIPVPNSVIVLQSANWGKLPYVSVTGGDILNVTISLTDSRAIATLLCITARDLVPNAYCLDDDFTTVRDTIDAGEAEGKFPSYIQWKTPLKTLALFSCTEYPIYERANPAMVGAQDITELKYLVLNGRLNSTPKKFGLSGVSSPYSSKFISVQQGPASIFMEEGEPMKLLTSQRVINLNTDEEHPLGKGYLQTAQFGPDYFFTAAKDMSRLNRERQEKLAGTADELSGIYKRKGDQALAETEQARKDCKWRDYLHKLHLAVGSQLKAYKQMTDVTNDMLKAVVFYLALMLPFCFFFIKLIFKFKRIEQEMAAFAVIFALTFCVFRAIHPAFRVAQAPEAILIAFIMGGLGLFVIKILHGRFEGEMQMLFKTDNAFDSGKAGFSTVGQSAMLIGVNNMKRRRVRTALTTATVILVTFTMLAFTSISKKMSPTVVRRSEQAPYTGLMYTWTGNQRMDENTCRTVQEILSPKMDIAVRRWALAPSVFGNTVVYKLFANNGNTVDVEALLGMGVNEEKFLGKLPLRAGRMFSANDAREIILPHSLAHALGIQDSNWKDARITLNGVSCAVVGLLDDYAFQELKDLNQHALMPIKNLVKQAADDDLAAMAEEKDDETGIFYTELSSMAILPVDTCKALGGTPYSISAKLKPGQELWPIVDEYITITNTAKFFIASTEPFTIGEGGNGKSTPGVYYIGEGYRTSIGGLAFLLIPLLISSTIILNTMLGSVFERKAEIAIYNAVGLNPTHIGMFFLAEAFVYSVIGSVGGYLIGQCTSIFLTRTGIVSDINLNFSSLTVVYVIIFTVAVVLLSTLYPSIVATRAAVPSGKRKWSLPANDGRVMPVVFPFIYQEDLIHGIMGYIDSYFARFTEASLGDLIAEFKGSRNGKDENGRDTLELVYNVALAPFDLGVTQELKFTVAYDQHIQAYRLAMQNTRMSGQDSNWTATNMPFLEKMRTYLMHWRNLSPAEHADFTRKGTKLFNLIP